MRGDERGAVAVLTAFLMVVVLGVGALVVDLGMQRAARGDMQGLADLVALDLARDLDGRTVAQLQPVLTADAALSVQRNRSVLGEGAPQLGIEMGQLGPTGIFVPMTTGVPTAVRVQAATKVAFAFAGITGVKDGAVARSAVANKEASACYTVGSYAASLDTQNSLLLVKGLIVLLAAAALFTVLRVAVGG